MVKYDNLRKNMVQCQLHTNSVRDARVLQAFASVPREMFVPRHAKGIAYNDEDMPLGKGRHLLAPVTHARLIEEANPAPDEIVLDLGCATGYSPAIWSGIVTTVIAIEDNDAMLREAQRNWDRLSVCNVAAFRADLPVGCPQHAPYDIIFMNGAVSCPPEKLLAQLVPNGRLMAVVMEAGQRMGCAVRFHRNESGHISSRKLFDIATPYLPGFEPVPSFAF